MLYANAWQTVGPYLHIGLDWLNTDTLAAEGCEGEHIRIEGVVVDGAGKPVPDGVVEIWQANACGRYRHPEDMRDLPLAEGFTGFGRMPTDAAGRYAFHTIKPGRVPGPDGALQAPHILVGVQARGILRRMSTRLYFPDEPANAEDYVLKLVPAARRDTLVASRADGAAGTYRFNVVLQGRWLGQGETVFFDF